MKNNSIKAVAMVGLLTASLAAGSMFAYLTGYDTEDKTFTVGNVAGSLTVAEGLDDIDSLYPTQVIEVSPVVSNTGANSAVAFVEVTIPADTIRTVGEGGAAEDAELIQLFDTLGAATGTEINSDWMQISTVTSVKESSKTVGYKYVYAYKKVLDKDASTEAVFDDMKFANIIFPDDQEGNLSYQLKFQTDLIQSGGLVAEEDEDDISKDDLEDIYTKYVNQNAE